MRILVGLLAVALAAWLVTYLFHFFFSGVSRNGRKELNSFRQRERIATQALRRIANTSGNPVLEAQIALDEIDATYDSKEN